MDKINKRILALQHNKSITEDHITKALSGEDVLVRLVAIQHPNANEEHLTKALDDIDEGVRDCAEKRLNRSTQTK